MKENNEKIKIKINLISKTKNELGKYIIRAQKYIKSKSNIKIKFY